MFVLGLQGSPRKKGNTSILLSAFMKEAERLGATTHTMEVYKKNILPCREYLVCEKKGYCPIDDDMKTEIYHQLRQAELIVMAGPMFFYSFPAQLKALIDRAQVLWARRYRLKLDDPGRKWRRGFLLALGATKGKNLFEGASLTAKYFYDAVGAKFDGSLTYRQIENLGDIKAHETALSDARGKAAEIMQPFMNRKKVLFLCRENACRSQMASAFTQYYAGDKIEVMSGGESPAEEINEVMEEVMREKGIDMAFRKPKNIGDAVGNSRLDMIFTMGCEGTCPVFPDAKMEDWKLPDPSGRSIEFMREIRDDIELRVLDLINKL